MDVSALGLHECVLPLGAVFMAFKSTLCLVAASATIPTRISKIKQSPETTRDLLWSGVEKHQPSCLAIIKRWERSLRGRGESSGRISNYRMLKEGGEVYFRCIDLQGEAGMLLLSGSYAHISSGIVPRDSLAANAHHVCRWRAGETADRCHILTRTHTLKEPHECTCSFSMSCLVIPKYSIQIK